MAGLGTQLVREGVRLVVFSRYGTSGRFFGHCDNWTKWRVSGVIPRIAEWMPFSRSCGEGTNGVPALKKADDVHPSTDDEPTKHLIDEQAGDAANFSHPYVELFRKAINRWTERPIRCERLLWSCEHHHIGRSPSSLTRDQSIACACHRTETRTRRSCIRPSPWPCRTGDGIGLEPIGPP